MKQILNDVKGKVGLLLKYLSYDSCSEITFNTVHTYLK